MSLFEHSHPPERMKLEVRRGRRRNKHNPKTFNQLRRQSYPIPSLSVLSILATFYVESVSATAADCPNFLCPFVVPSPTAGSSIARAHPSSSYLFSPQPVPKRRNDLSRRSDHTGDPQKLPTKYLMDQDGRYRPESSWSLNGKTLTCSWTTSTPSSIDDEMDNADSALSPADVGLPENSALSTTTSSPSNQPPDDLPAGWARQPPRSSFYQVPIIVVFALTLTLFITILIASCALLRRKRRMRKLKLLQKEVSSELEQGLDDVNDSSWVKHLRKQRKSWVRSSVKWKSKAHLTMRRRRPRSSSSITSISGSISRQSPRVSVEHLNVSNDPIMLESPMSSGVAALPPAYPDRNASTSQNQSSQVGELSRLSPSKPHLSSSRVGIPTRDMAMLGGHVATDDKAVLERMAQCASAPELDELTEPEPHAPELSETDQDLEDEEAVEVGRQADLLYPMPGSHIIPTILSVYDGLDDSRSNPLLPSSPLEELPVSTLASAPPMEDF